MNTFGLLEEVDALSDLSVEVGAKSVAVIDPLLLSAGGLKPPAEFGSNGVDIIVGEATSCCPYLISGARAGALVCGSPIKIAQVFGPLRVDSSVRLVTVRAATARSAFLQPGAAYP